MALALAILVCLLGPAVGAAAEPVAPAATTTGPTLRLSVDSITPQAPAPGTTLTVTGTVTNAGTRAVERANVALRLRQQPLAARSELPLADAGKGEFSVPGPTLGKLADLGGIPAGQTKSFQISVPLSAQTLGGFGVYPFAVEARAALPGQARQRGAIQYTLLPWAPTTVAPTQLVWMLPLVDHPTRTTDGVFSDDTLGVSLADGRLRRLLGIGITAQSTDRISVAWVVDPDLLAAVETMAKGYRVRSGDGKTVPGTHAADAASWLDSLRTATAGRQVVVLPYGDPDLVALFRAHLESDLTHALDRAREVATRALPSAVLTTDIGWPAAGYIAPSTAAALPDLGLTTLVLNGNALLPDSQVTFTPTGRAVLPGTNAKLDALLAEPELARIVNTTPRGDTDRTLALQRFLAQTAFITAERPSRSRVVLVAPTRRWDPDLTLLGALLEATSGRSVPWLRSATLDQLRAAPQDSVLREELAYPASVRAQELPSDYLRAVADVHDQMRLLSSILLTQQPLMTELEDAVLRAESSAWRGRGLPAGRHFLYQLTRATADTLGKVRVVAGRVNFSTRKGSLPVTVVNDLDQAVTVQITLYPHPARLRVINSPPPLRLPAHRRVQIAVDAEAIAPGRTEVDVQLLTPEGQPYSASTTVHVRVTTVGTVALVVTLAALAVLFGTAGVRIVRRLINARRRRGPDDATLHPSGAPEEVGRP